MQRSGSLLLPMMGHPSSLTSDSTPSPLASSVKQRADSSELARCLFSRLLCTLWA